MVEMLKCGAVFEPEMSKNRIKPRVQHSLPISKIIM